MPGIREGTSQSLLFLPSHLVSQYLWISQVHTTASLVAQLVENPTAMQETCVQSLGWEDALEEEMATHSSIPAWEIPWTEKSGGLQSMELQELDVT